MRAEKLITPTAVYYPESDGTPMAETDIHCQLLMELRFTLKSYFEREPDVYVGTNLFIYYVEGDPTKCVAPDVFVVRGVGKHPRRVYLLWEEGRVPDVVLELTSKKTVREDLQRKWQVYQRWGVKEYYVYDPEYSAIDPPLVAYKWDGGEYREVEVVGGRVRSEALGLEVVDTGETLRLYDPREGRFLPTPAEEAEARRQAEEALRAEAEARRRVEEALHAETEARRRAEAEIERLRQQLERKKSRK